MATVGRRHDVMHRRKEAVLGADVGKRFDVEIAIKRQPPVTLARPRTPRQVLGWVARLQVVRV